MGEGEWQRLPGQERGGHLGRGGDSPAVNAEDPQLTSEGRGAKSQVTSDFPGDQTHMV